MIRAYHVDRDALITEHLNLVHWAAHKLRKRHSSVRRMEYEEVVSLGMVGLVMASKKFDPQRGFRFSTYAVRAIYQHMERGAMKNSRKNPTLLPLKECALADPRQPRDRLMQREEVERCLKLLRKSDARLVRWKFLRGKSLREIGDHLGVSDQTICVRLSKAMRRLRELVDN